MHKETAFVWPCRYHCYVYYLISKRNEVVLQKVSLLWPWIYSVVGIYALAFNESVRCNVRARAREKASYQTIRQIIIYRLHKMRSAFIKCAVCSHTTNERKREPQITASLNDEMMRTFDRAWMQLGNSLLFTSILLLLSHCNIPLQNWIEHRKIRFRNEQKNYPEYWMRHQEIWWMQLQQEEIYLLK